MEAGDGACQRPAAVLQPVRVEERPLLRRMVRGVELRLLRPAPGGGGWGPRSVAARWDQGGPGPRGVSSLRRGGAAVSRRRQEIMSIYMGKITFPI